MPDHALALLVMAVSQKSQSLAKPKRRKAARAKVKYEAFDLKSTWGAMQKKIVPHVIGTATITILGSPIISFGREILPTPVPITPITTMLWLATGFCFSADLFKQIKRNNSIAESAGMEGMPEVRIKPNKFYAATAFIALQMISTLCIAGNITPYQRDVDDAITAHLKVLQQTNKVIDDAFAHPTNEGITVWLADMGSKRKSPPINIPWNDIAELRAPVTVNCNSGKDIRDAYCRIMVAAGQYKQSTNNPKLKAQAEILEQHGREMLDNPRFTNIARAVQP